MDKWISVDDALPDEGVDVLTYRVGGVMFVDHMERFPYRHDLSWYGDFLDPDLGIDGWVRFWRPLPDAPKG